MPTLENHLDNDRYYKVWVRLLRWNSRFQRRHLCSFDNFLSKFRRRSCFLSPSMADRIGIQVFYPYDSVIMDLDASWLSQIKVLGSQNANLWKKFEQPWVFTKPKRLLIGNFDINFIILSYYSLTKQLRCGSCFPHPPMSDKSLIQGLLSLR